jgi:trimethylamine:corrinoid methyltransferase-like protein
MSTLLRVLTDAETARIHEESVSVLARTGLRIDSANARRLLGEAMTATASHVPLPFADGVDAELERLERAARGS